MPAGSTSKGLEVVVDVLPNGDSAVRGRLLACLALETGSDDGAEALAMGHRLHDPELICLALTARCQYVVGQPRDQWPELEPLARELRVLADAAGLSSYRAGARRFL